MSKPSAEVHAGRLSVPLQALTFSVADVLKDLDPLFDENRSTSKHDSSKWAEQSLAYCVGFQPARPQLSVFERPGFSYCCHFEALQISFTPRCHSPLSCINVYLTIYIDGYFVNE